MVSSFWSDELYRSWSEIINFIGGDSLEVLTHCGRVTQICIFKLQLCRTDDANLHF